MTSRRAIAVAVATALAVLLPACGDSATGTLLTDKPVHYLVTLDQLASPDFTVLDQAQPADPAAITGVDTALATAAQRDGWQAGASVRFFRSVPLDTSNGPVDVIAAAARFESTDGAHSWFSDYRSSRAHVSGAQSLSTGPLGEESGATSLLASTTEGVAAVQVVVVWRVANVVNIIVVRGRYGGARLDDALYLARQQTANEHPS